MKIVVVIVVVVVIGRCRYAAIFMPRGRAEAPCAIPKKLAASCAFLGQTGRRRSGNRSNTTRRALAAAQPLDTCECLT
jgi:hypothetical protein